MRTEYPFAPHVKPGDYVLTSLRNTETICYVDLVTEVWEYDETWCIRLDTGEVMSFYADDPVTVIRAN